MKVYFVLLLINYCILHKNNCKPSTPPCIFLQILSSDSHSAIFLKFYVLIIERERKGEGGGEKHTDLLFHLFMHSLVNSCMCPDRGLNPQPWCMGMMLESTKPPNQGSASFDGGTCFISQGVKGILSNRTDNASSCCYIDLLGEH